MHGGAAAGSGLRDARCDLAKVVLKMDRGETEERKRAYGTEIRVSHHPGGIGMRGGDGLRETGGQLTHQLPCLVP